MSDVSFYHVRGPRFRRPDLLESAALLLKAHSSFEERLVGRDSACWLKLLYL